MDSQLRVVGNGVGVSSLVFGWAQVAERRVAALSIVERFDVLENVGFRVRAILVVAMAGKFDFERSEEAFGHGVVVTVPSAAHATCDPRLVQKRLVVRRGVLASLVAVAEGAAAVAVQSAPRERHLQSARGELPRESLPHRVADDAAAKQVQHNREVEPTLARRYVGDESTSTSGSARRPQTGGPAGSGPLAGPWSESVVALNACFCLA